MSVGTFFNLIDNHYDGDQSFSEDHNSLSVLVDSYTKQSMKQCVFCNLRNHRCLRVTEPATRKQILRQNKNCFIGFYFGYISKNCNWDHKCKCNRKHNVRICTWSNNQEDRFNSNYENG